MRLLKPAVRGAIVGAMVGIVLAFIPKTKEPIVLPEILILRETTETEYGRQVLILDYMVGGIATNATFRPHQMNEYKAVLAHLKRSGRLRYATPLLEPLE